MTDYSSWKVADLKAELKRRGIPQTGLRLKQHFVDKLAENDANQAGEIAEEPPQEPHTEKHEQQTEGDQHTQQEIPPSFEPQQSIPDKAELQEQEKGEDLESQHVADTEKQDEPKTALGEDVEAGEEQRDQQVKGAVDQPQPEEQAKVEGEISAVPAEQTPGDTITQEPTPAAPEGADSTVLAQKPGPSAPSGSEVNTELSTPVPTEEAIEDSRKRKRRSKSPVPTSDAIANKKARARSESPRVLLPEDTSTGNAPAEKEPIDTAAAHEPQATPDEHALHRSVPEDARGRKRAPLKQDARFKELFAPTEQVPTRPASPPRDVTMQDAEVEPALHVATTALYVDGLMRPLQPAALKSHLISLASAPETPPNSDVIIDFYLDSIKTHCFVSFANVAAASRARSALHGAVWPNERNRKTLFVDFIPEHKMQQWINTEGESRGRGGRAPRWGVKYERTDDGIEAILEEVGATGAAPQGPSRDPTAPRAPPTGPRASFPQTDRRPSGPPAADSHPQPGQGFQPLDDLFMSTTTKPKLYYLPCSRETADRRLDRFDDLIRKGAYPRRGGDETRRISFENGDSFVDNGAEFGNRNRRRGGRGRGRGFGWRDDRRGRH